MSNITKGIDGVVLRHLKLHHTTKEDLLQHISNRLTSKYPDAEFTIPGIAARLELLPEQFQIEQSEINNRPVWKLCGDSITMPDRIWQIITSLAKLECFIQSVIYTIRKQHKSISPHDIKNAIGTLQSNGIIQIRNSVATASEGRFLTREIML